MCCPPAYKSIFSWGARKGRSMKWSFVKFICQLGFVACLVMVGTARAQNVGSLSGTVSDPSGAAIPGAKVTITDPGSGFSRSVQSDKSGEFSFAQLNPGTYRLEVTKDRFKTFIAEKVSVLVATPTEFLVKLELGAMSEQVVVESAAPALNTQDATVGNAIDEQDVKSLPFLARNVFNF